MTKLFWQIIKRELNSPVKILFKSKERLKKGPQQLQNVQRSKEKVNIKWTSLHLL